MISNNGALSEIQDFIKEQDQVYSRIKVINYQQNILILCHLELLTDQLLI